MREIYHANMIFGEIDHHREFVLSILENDLNFSIKANPDFLLIENNSFGIDDARNLSKWAIGRPLTGGKKVTFIITKSITFEAQNALLKVLEEPPAGTYIFISLESMGGLLPTFISRVKVLEVADNNAGAETLKEKEYQNEACEFISSKIKDKLSIVKSASKNNDKLRMKELIKNLEKISYLNYSKNRPVNSPDTKALRSILTAKTFSSVRGSSPKMLLEWLSCML